MKADFRRPRFPFDAALVEAAQTKEPPAPNASEFLRQAEQAAGDLLTYADSPATEGGDPAAAVRRFVELASACGPFVAAAPRLLEAIEGELARHLPEGADVPAAAGYPDSPAAQEIRNLYRIAYRISKQAAARELVLELSARRTADRLKADLPEIWQMLDRHLEDFGWVRTWNTPLPPLGGKEAVQRMQNALLRWDGATIGVAAGEVEPGGKAPSRVQLPPEAEPLAAAYRQIAAGIAFTPALFARARWAAGHLWSRVAERCGWPPDLVAWATPDEVIRALEADVDPRDLAARRDNGFTLHQEVDGIHAHANHTPPEPSNELAGQSVSLGRAVGRVKVVLDADEGGKLLPGDILVTDLSTPTYEGQPSVFPYRGIPSVAVEKAAAIVTDEGGLLSHAAIVCREHHVPSVLGTETATSILRDGMIVEVDATRAAGTVTVLEG